MVLPRPTAYRALNPAILQNEGYGVQAWANGPVPRGEVPSGGMPEIDRPIGVVCQQCPSCESAEVMRTSVEEGKVWLVCGRCALRWSIAERRSAAASDYRGFERRRPVNG
jgi:hypothetical protein